MAKKFYDCKTVVYPVNKFTGENDCPAGNDNCKGCPHCGAIGFSCEEGFCVDCEYPAEVHKKQKFNMEKTECPAASARKELRVRAYAYFFEDADLVIDGEWCSESNDDPKMPCVVKDGQGKPLCWAPVIDPETGIILNWTEGIEAQIYYKTADMCELEYVLINPDGSETVVCKKKNYVPRFLEISDTNYGDNIYVDVKKDGEIYGWDKGGFNKWVIDNCPKSYKDVLC